LTDLPLWKILSAFVELSSVTQAKASSKQAILLVACLCVAPLLVSSSALAQAIDEVHVTPRRTPENRLPEPDRTQTSNPSDPQARVKPIRVDVDLVLVPVVVNDAMSRPVLNLAKQNFALFEDSKPQEIRYFAEEEAPISIAVLFDFSRSMSDKIENERAAVHQFFDNANPEDEYFAIAFSKHPVLLDGPTQSIDEVEQKLTSIEPGGSTAMLDAIYLAETQLRSAKYKRKAIVIFSDGGDNSSRYTMREIKKVVAESDVQIYALGLFETFFFNTIEERLGKRWLREITDRTGGRTITIDSRAKLPEAAAEVSRELRNEYVLGYRPTSFDGKWRNIRVQLVPPQERSALQAHYKQGYYSPER
jgi:Ca-activated chloride channel homolog